jgi:hypothetical protein
MIRVFLILAFAPMLHAQTANVAASTVSVPVTIPAQVVTVPKNGGKVTIPSQTITIIVKIPASTVPVSLSGFSGTFTCLSGTPTYDSTGKLTATMGIACTVTKP